MSPCRLCKGGCGLRCAAQPPLGLSQENWSLALTAPSDKAPALPRAGASGETPRSAQTSGRVTRGSQNALTNPPPPPPLPRLCKVCRRTSCGPQNTPPPPAFGIPHSEKGQRSQRGTLRLGESPLARAQNVGMGVRSSGGVRTRHPPPPPDPGTGVTLTGAEPPERRGGAGRFLRGPARARADPNFSRLLSPEAARARAQTEGAGSRPRRRCRLSPRGGRELAAHGPLARAGSTFPQSARYWLRPLPRRKLTLQPLGLQLPPPPGPERVAA